MIVMAMDIVAIWDLEGMGGDTYSACHRLKNPNVW